MTEHCAGDASAAFKIAYCAKVLVFAKNKARLIIWKFSFTEPYSSIPKLLTAKGLRLQTNLNTC